MKTIATILNRIAERNRMRVIAAERERQARERRNRRAVA